MEKSRIVQSKVDMLVNEIMKYKWLESEKAGKDIGEDTAARKWISDHYNEWFNYHILENSSMSR